MDWYVFDFRIFSKKNKKKQNLFYDDSLLSYFFLLFLFFVLKSEKERTLYSAVPYRLHTILPFLMLITEDSARQSLLTCICFPDARQQRRSQEV